MEAVTERLNQIYDKITNQDFLKCKGLGNEIAFYIFDYKPEDELKVREYINFLITRITSQTQLKVANVNLFEVLVNHLKERDLLEKSYQKEISKGIAYLKKAIKAPLKTENLVKIFCDSFKPNECDIIFISGIGNSWPLARAHLLLNNLQPVLLDKPLVLFYPGCYDGQSFKLFNNLKSNPYYRAFRLVQ